jgi:hypothetical protein
VTAQFVPSYTTDLADAYRLLTPTAVKTGGYSAVAGDFVPVDTTAGAVAVTLPAAPADKAVVAVKQVIQGGTNTVTVNCAGSDVFNKAGGSTSATLTLLSQAIVLQYKASSGIWYVVADDLPLSQLDGRFVRVGSGDNANIWGATTTGVLGQVALGTAASPNASLNPALKVVNTVGAVDNASVAGDGAEQLATIHGVAVGTVGAQQQVTAVVGTAKSAGNSGTVPDAAGGYFVGRITGGGIGAGFGAAIYGRKDVANTAGGITTRARGIELGVQN